VSGTTSGTPYWGLGAPDVVPRRREGGVLPPGLRPLAAAPRVTVMSFPVRDVVRLAEKVADADNLS